jgi:WD40 repeat protein
MATGSADKSVIIWDAKTFKQLRRMEGQHGDTVWAVAFAPDGKTLYTGDSNKRIIAWNVANGELKLKFKAYNDVKRIAVSPDGKLVAVAADDKVLALYDQAGDIAKKLKGHNDEVRAVAFSPDGARLASGSSDNTVIIWDLGAAKSLFTLKGHTNNIQALAYTPDGKYVVSGDRDNLVIVWNAATGEQVQVLNDHGGTVKGFAFAGGKMVSVDSRTNVSFAFGIPVKQDAGNTCKVIVWDMAKWKAESKLESDCEANDIASNGSIFGVAAKSTSIFGPAK